MDGLRLARRRPLRNQSRRHPRDRWSGQHQALHARLRRPSQLIALDVKPYRLDLDPRFGPDVAIDVTQEDVVQKVRDLTAGHGCDVYIEATGHPSGVTQELQIVRKLGAFVEFSVFNEPAAVNWTIIGDGSDPGAGRGNGRRQAAARRLLPLPQFDRAIAPLSQ